MTNSKTYVVYWARLESHSDVMSEGYVGITIDFDERKRAHFKAANNRRKNKKSHFQYALKKYKDAVIWEFLHEGLTEEEALIWENLYRPTINIAWNSLVGGERGVSAEWYDDDKNKQKHRENTSEATKLRIAEKDSPEARAQRAQEVWDKDGYRESREGLFAGENNPQFGKFGADHPAAGHKKTEAGRKAISDAQKGRTVSETSRQKLSKSRIEKYADQKAAREKKLEAERHEKKKQREADKLTGKFKGENARASKFSDSERQLICKRRVDGETYSAIGKTYGKGVTTIKNICATWGPKNGYPFERKIGQSELKKVTSEEDKTAICKKYAAGSSATDLAKKYNLSFQQIYLFVAEHGPKNGIPYVQQKSKKSTG